MCTHTHTDTHREAKTNWLFVHGCVCTCVCKAPRCLSTAGEIRSVRGHLQRVDTKGRSQPPARPNSSKLGRWKDFSRWGSVLGIHPEPTLKTDDGRPHRPWRSNRAKMQAVNQEGFAMPVFNYWHFQRCKSVLSTQQEKTHLHFCFNPISFIRPRLVWTAVWWASCK